MLLSLDPYAGANDLGHESLEQLKTQQLFIDRHKNKQNTQLSSELKENTTADSKKSAVDRRYSSCPLNV